MKKKKQWTLKLNMKQDIKAKKKQGASNRIMKVIQLEDEPLIPKHCRIKKVIELEEDYHQFSFRKACLHYY